jgi:hypothetical protein
LGKGLWETALSYFQTDTQELFMTFDTVIGVGLTAIALGAVVLLTLWSRRIIERIHNHSPGSLRKIQKDIINGKAS